MFARTSIVFCKPVDITGYPELESLCLIYVVELFSVICIAGSNWSVDCLPGWYRTGKSCHLFYLESVRSWQKARLFCHTQRSDLAVIPNRNELKHLSSIAANLGGSSKSLYLGLSAEMRWIWQEIGKTARANLWGPREPSGDGRCGSLLNAIKWNAAWAGQGWRWNDISCHKKQGYICEEPTGKLYDELHR